MSSYARPAIGHMPFPGHRTCAQWDKPVAPHQEKREEWPVKPFDFTLMKSDYLFLPAPMTHRMSDERAR